MARYIPDEIEAYAERYTSARADVFDRLGAETQANHANPQMMVGVIEGFRWALLGAAQPDFRAMAISVGVIAVSLGLGLLYFRRMERSFADVI